MAIAYSGHSKLPRHLHSNWVDLLLTSIGFLVLSGPRFVVADNLVRQSVSISLILLFLLLRHKRTVSIAGGSRPFAALFLFTLFCFISTFWSTDYRATLGSAALLFLAVSFGSVAGRRLSPELGMWAIIFFAALAGVISLAAVLLDPGSAVVSGNYQSGKVQGIYTHRNNLAYVATIGVLTATAGLLMRVSAHRLVLLTSLSLLFYVMFRAASATAALVCLVSILFLVLVKYLSVLKPRIRKLILFLFFATVAPFVVFVSTQIGGVFALFGRDETLTGRTVIWEVVTVAWSKSPWIGFGWGASWGEESPLQLWVSETLGFRLAHAHNGYLDLLLQVGIIGLALILFAVLLTLKPALDQVLNSSSTQVSHILTLVLIFMLLLYSVTESRIAATFGISLLAFLAAQTIPKNISPNLVCGELR